MTAFIPGGLDTLGVGLTYLDASDIERTYSAIADRTGAERRAEDEARRARLARDVSLPGGIEELGVGLSMLGGEDVEATREGRQRAATELLNAERDRLSILSQIAGLTESERAAMSSLVIEAEKRARLSEQFLHAALFGMSAGTAASTQAT